MNDTVQMNKQTGEILDENKKGDDLEEGELYVVKKGELEHLQRDPDDTMRKVRITDDAHTVAINVQRMMRKEMNGYKPDIVMVCSALIASFDEREEAAGIVKDYIRNTFGF